MSAQGFPTAPVRYDVFRLIGGLDLVTPTQSLPPGVARDSLNFEVSVEGGYSRIAGYERYDGRALPSSATYNVVVLTSLVGVVAGATITDAALTKSGVVLGLNSATNAVYYTRQVGSFATGDVVYIGGASVGTVTALAAPTLNASDVAKYKALAADNLRGDIAQVPGSGPVRGLAYLSNTLYAWRDNAGATALAIYKATGSGWSPVSLGYELSFTTGTSTAIAEGDTVTGGTSGATGVVARVVVETTGNWAGAAGRLILSSTTGTFQAAEALNVTGTQRATCSGAATAIAPAAGGRVETWIANMGGATGASRIYGVDGVNRGFEFDGQTYVPIKTGMTLDKPTHVIVHKNYLFFSFKGSVQWSSLGAPYIWSPILGAGEIVLPEDVTAFRILPGDQNSSALSIYSRNNSFILYGNSASAFSLTTFDNGTGCNAYTTQSIADAYMLDDRGVITLATTRNFSNFDSSTLTFHLRPFIARNRGLATASGVSREKAQYRVFFSNGYGLYLTIVDQQFRGAMPVWFPVPVNCWVDGENANGDEVSYFGSGVDGMVYRMDSGTSFDGVAIPAYVKLNFNPQSNARVLKRYRRASLEVTGNGYADFSFGYLLGYESLDIDQANYANYTAPFLSSNWDGVTWDNFIWDGKTLAPIEVVCEGTAENIALLISSNSKIASSFTINSAALHYSARRGIR